MPKLNSYALVAYLRGPLADFVDNLRCGFTPGCTHRAHITLLPPRPLSVEADEAIEYCKDVLRSTEPFDVRAGTVNLFASSDVIKLSLGAGSERLRVLHDKLNQGPLRHDEKFGYEPHITLAQDLPSEHVQDCLQRAREAWVRFGREPVLMLDVFTFVQEVECNRWRDLVSLQLGSRKGTRARPVNGARQPTAHPAVRR